MYLYLKLFNKKINSVEVLLKNEIGKAAFSLFEYNLNSMNKQYLPHCSLVIGRPRIFPQRNL
jgi:hypothetical protein